MAAKREPAQAFRQFPCGLQDHPQFINMSTMADHLIRVLITDELLATPIPGVCIKAGLGLIAYCMRSKDESAVEAALLELENLDLAVVDWSVKLIYIPDALRRSSAPRTVRAIKAWERTWRRLPDCELRDQIEADVREMLAGQKAKVAHAFEVMCGKVALPEARTPQKRGPKPGSKREKKSEEVSRINSEKKDQKNSEVISKKDFISPNSSEVSPNEFQETRNNSKFLEEASDKFRGTAVGSNDFNDFDSLFPTQNLDEIWSENREEIRDRRPETGDRRPEPSLPEREQIGESYDSPQCRVGEKSAENLAEPDLAADCQSAVEPEDETSQQEPSTSIETAMQRRSGPSTPPPMQRTLFGAPAASRVEAPEAAPMRKKAKSALRYPDLCRRVVDELNRARSAVAPEKNLRGLESASDSGLQLLDGRIAELMGKFGEADEVVGILSDVVWARAWELGIAPRGGNDLEDWHGKFKWLNLSAPFTGPHGGKQGGWIMSEAIRAEWIEAGRPEPYQKRARVRDIRQGSIVAAYDPEDFANVEAIHNHRQAEMRREYIEKLTREGKEIPEYILNEY